MTKNEFILLTGKIEDSRLRQLSYISVSHNSTSVKDYLNVSYSGTSQVTIERQYAEKGSFWKLPSLNEFGKYFIFIPKAILFLDIEQNKEYFLLADEALPVSSFSISKNSNGVYFLHYRCSKSLYIFCLVGDILFTLKKGYPFYRKGMFPLRDSETVYNQLKGLS